MTKLSIVLAFMLLSLFSYAQYEPDGYFGLSAGAAFPAGEMGAADLFEPGSGFATTGANFQGLFAYRIWDRVGLAGMGVYSFLPMDKNSVEEDLALVSGYENEDFTVSTNDWSLFGLLGGGTAIFQLNRRFTADARVLFGYLQYTYPEMSVAGPGIGENVLREEVSVSTIGFNVGAGAKYALNHFMYFMVNADYLFGTPEFEDFTVIDKNNKNIQRSISPTYGNLNFTAGLAFFID